MYEYLPSQWLLFFFAYCFLGWIWESCFVSARKGQWVNRGFLHGPVIPLYGTGAIVILFLTLPVRNNIALIYLLGMVGATLLEYFTGELMERLFHVRYWDYSKKRFNLNGHICLACSLGWGAFSVGLIKLIHPPLEGLILWLPHWAADPLSLIILVAFTVDATRSVQNAIDLKKLLESLAENNSKAAELQAKIEDITAAVNQRKARTRQILRERAESFGERAYFRRAESLLKRNPSAASSHHGLELEELKRLFENRGNKKA